VQSQSTQTVRTSKDEGPACDDEASGEVGGDEGGLMSSATSSIPTGSIAEGAFEEDGAEEEEDEEEDAPTDMVRRWWFAGTLLRPATACLRFLMSCRTGFPRTLLQSMFTQSSASSGVAAIKTKRSWPPSAGPLLD